MEERIRLLTTCTDRPGIVAAVSNFLFERGANIVDAEQHSTGDRFFLRVEAELEEDPSVEFGELAERFDMDWRIARSNPEKRVAILVSRYDHCLLDLLWRFEQHELEGRPAMVISNHPELAERVASHGLAFHHVPSDDKQAAEARFLELTADVDLVVLARGVKVIGATAHYVTAVLDDGPIIEQDVARVSHRDSRADLVRIGRDIERLVLARAVKWHIEDRVITDGARTVVFR